jgi:hypothetical protein
MLAAPGSAGDLLTAGMRAVTTFAAAAVAAFVDWMLVGPRQHEADLLLSIGICHPAQLSETSGEGGARC